MTGGLLISLRTEDNQCVISDESRPFVIGTHFILMAAVDDGLSERLAVSLWVGHRLFNSFIFGPIRTCQKAQDNENAPPGVLGPRPHPLPKRPQCSTRQHLGKEGSQSDWLAWHLIGCRYLPAPNRDLVFA